MFLNKVLFFWSFRLRNIYFLWFLFLYFFFRLFLYNSLLYWNILFFFFRFLFFNFLFFLFLYLFLDLFFDLFFFCFKPIIHTINNNSHELFDVNSKILHLTCNFIFFSNKFLNIIWSPFKKDIHLGIPSKTEHISE